MMKSDYVDAATASNGATTTTTTATARKTDLSLKLHPQLSLKAITVLKKENKKQRSQQSSLSWWEREKEEGQQ